MLEKQNVATVETGSCLTVVGVLIAGPYSLLGRTGMYGRVESNGFIFSGEIISLREEEVRPERGHLTIVK